MNASVSNRNILLAGVCGLVLVLSLFLPWYGATVTFGGVSSSATATAWRALTTTRVVLLVLGLAAAAIAMFEASSAATPGRIRTANLVLVAIGALAAILVVYRLIRIPLGGSLPPGIHLTREEGGIMALVASLGISFGGVRAWLEGARRNGLLEHRARCVGPGLADLKDRVR